MRARGGRLADDERSASTSRSLSAGVSYLAHLQHSQGSWTDFWLPVGTSDEWVTAYVGLALSAAAGCPLLDPSARAIAADRASRAAQWLLRRQHPLGGWGYNATVPPDADSTAHALSLLARVQIAAPAEAVAFLRAHEVSGEGFRTYKWRDRDHQWTRPCADVTAAALRALHDLRILSQSELRAAWLATLGRSQDDRGWWNGYWWTSPNYTTGLALEVWNAAGRPPLARGVSHSLPADDAFDLAWGIYAYGFCAERSPHPLPPPRVGEGDTGSARQGLGDESQEMRSRRPHSTEPTLLEAGTGLRHAVPSPRRGGAGRGSDDQIAALVEQMIGLQAPDGGWPSAPILRVPPSHALAGSQRQPIVARDARRLFVTATVVRVLAFVGQHVARSEREDDGRGPESDAMPAPNRTERGRPPDRREGGETSESGGCALREDASNSPSAHRLSGDGASGEDEGERRRSRRLALGQSVSDAFLTAALQGGTAVHGGGLIHQTTHDRPLATVGAFVRRSTLGQALDELVERAARGVGFSDGEADEARDVFAALTQESLAEPCPWPSAQISSLAGGAPLEFSATVSRDVRPALRYAVEVGNPYLAPYERARSGVVAVARTAARLGYDAAWQRVAPAVDLLVATELAVPDGLRFWVWSGIDQAVSTDDARSVPGLKIYLNLLNYEVGSTRQRIEAALAAAAIPLSRELGATLDLLDGAGFPHELGFGLGPNGKIACKIYYELDGWRRSLVHRVLEIAGLPADADAICPEIPGVLRESLAAKSRAGIALRIDPTSGAVRELTTAAAFPPPMVPHGETGRRVAAWIDANGWEGTPYLALRTLLLPAWEDSQGAEGRLHSLFTRTISSDGAWTAIYLRPYLRQKAGG